MLKRNTNEYTKRCRLPWNCSKSSWKRERKLSGVRLRSSGPEMPATGKDSVRTSLTSASFGFVYALLQPFNTTSAMSVLA